MRRKHTDGSKELARQFRARRQIVTLVDDPHLRRLALTAWDLGGDAKYESLRLKEHAHTFGFTGQLITKSRAFSTTFAALRSARTEYMAGERDGDPVEGTFSLRRSWLRRSSDHPARGAVLQFRTGTQSGSPRQGTREVRSDSNLRFLPLNSLQRDGVHRSPRPLE